MKWDRYFQIIRNDPVRLSKERHRLLELVQSIAPSGTVSEIGSTAVEGVIGKEDIDFAVVVAGEQFPHVRDAMDGMFSRNSNQISNEHFQGYIFDSEFDASIQLLIQGGDHDIFHEFLNHLRTDEALKESYNALKRKSNGAPMEDYRAAKQKFIEDALAGNRPPRSNSRSIP